MAASPGFIDWGRYLRANKDVAGQMAERTAQGLESAAQKAEGSAADATTALSGATAAKGGPRQTLNLGAADEDLKSQLGQLRGRAAQGYAGPQGLSGEAAGRISGGVAEAQRRYALMGTTGGRQAALGEAYGGAGAPAARRFDVGLAESAGLGDRLGQLKGRFEGLGSLLEGARGRAAGDVADAQARWTEEGTQSGRMADEIQVELNRRAEARRVREDAAAAEKWRREHPREANVETVRATVPGGVAGPLGQTEETLGAETYKRKDPLEGVGKWIRGLFGLGG